MNAIASVTLHRRSVPLVRPFVTAVRTATTIDVLIVEVTDQQGRSGWGEAPTSWRVTGESPASVTAAIDGPLSEAVIGLPVDAPAEASLALARAVVGNSAARMAVDCAIYDLAAQSAGVPLQQLLGAAASWADTTPLKADRTSTLRAGSAALRREDSAARRLEDSAARRQADSASPQVGSAQLPWPDTGATSSVVRTDMTLSAVSDADGIATLVEAAARHRDAGFRTLKVKVGAGGDDIAGMRAVREAVGRTVTLRADANQGWTPEQAVTVIRGWEDAGLDVELVEQPVHRDDLDGLAFVTSRVDTAVLADESVWTTRDAREVIARHSADMINIKLAKTGGIREALSLLDLAVEAEVATIVGCMMESHVGIGAAAALAAVVDARSAGPQRAHDLDAGLWLREKPILGGVHYDGEDVHLPDGPGLSIEGLTG